MAAVLRERRHTDFLAAHANLAAYQARCEGRPAFRRALEAQLAVFEKHPPEAACTPSPLPPPPPPPARNRNTRGRTCCCRGGLRPAKTNPHNPPTRRRRPQLRLRTRRPGGEGERVGG